MHEQIFFLEMYIYIFCSQVNALVAVRCPLRCLIRLFAMQSHLFGKSRLPLIVVPFVQASRIHP